MVSSSCTLIGWSKERGVGYPCDGWFTIFSPGFFNDARFHGKNFPRENAVIFASVCILLSQALCPLPNCVNDYHLETGANLDTPPPTHTSSFTSQQQLLVILHNGLITIKASWP